MTNGADIQPLGDRLRKALKWLAETQLEKPNKERIVLLREAEIRFNLTPRESEFLEKNFLL